MFKPRWPHYKDISWKMMFWMLFDAAAIVVSYFLIIWFAFALAIPYRLDTLSVVFSTALIFQLLVYTLFGLYRIIIRFTSIEDILLTSFVVFSSNVMLWVVFRSLGLLPYMTLLFFFTVMIQWLIKSGARASYRLFRLFDNLITFNPQKSKNTLIIGGGGGAELVVKDLHKASIVRSGLKVILDDDVKKHRRTLLGVPIIGGTDQLSDALDRYHISEVIIAINNPPLKKYKLWLNELTQKNIQVKRLPAINQISDSKPLTLVDVKVEELLNRDPIELDTVTLAEFLKDRTVLVTGAGGSIGSELCRQIAAFKPRSLILYDIYENSTYDIQLELQKNFPDISLNVIIGSVYNAQRLESVYKQFSPSHVFHAAAYKHVPLMEDSSIEAIRTNVIGTYHAARLAGEYHVKHFILVSSDKAVRPTNVMGATKRLAELMLTPLQEQYQTIYAAVRFGNVLNSNGSVVPLFRKQIEQGGPITVTHPEITRYFMTIPEAVSLILQAGVYAQSADVFILDMGDPVKIVDLAEKMIRLSGFKPYEDIDIVYTGLRPGEKLYEELLVDESSGIQKTANDLIFIEKNHHQEHLNDLGFITALESCDAWTGDEVRQFLLDQVKSYQPLHDEMKN